MRWQGRVEVSALWFPPGSASSLRLAQAWETGARLLQAHGGVLLLLSSLRPVRAENSAALPLVKLDEGWASYPAARPVRGEVVLFWQGQVWRHALGSLPPVDLAELWEASEMVYLEGKPLAEPRGAPLLRNDSKGETLQEILPSVPAAARERDEWMRRQADPTTDKRTNPLLGLFDLLRSLVGQDQDQRYISKMLEMFEKKQWDQALRHAIPLNHDSVASRAISSFRSLFRPRRDLSYTPVGQVVPSVETSLQGMDLLRSVYRSAYDSLIEAQRYEEAAYVMAELLGYPHDAVEMLEGQKMYEAAARLATAKGLPADLQVRLWFRSGKVETAMTVARHHQAYAEAAVALERLDQAAGERFRIAWAEDLVRLGQTAEALSVGWEVRSKLPLYQEWMRETLAAGGPAAWQAAVLTSRDSVLSREVALARTLELWFAPGGAITSEGRQFILVALGQRQGVTEDADLARWAERTARSVMRQAGGPFAVGDDQSLGALVKLSNDPWLRVDAPRTLPKLDLRRESWHQKVMQRGQLPLHDAVDLGDGRVLVALGHAGLAVLSRGGALSQSFSQPAHRLVVPRQGNLFLTVSGRQLGFYQQGRAFPWCSAQVDGYAREHDGFHWWVWKATELYRVDLTPSNQDGKRDWAALEQMSFPAGILAVKTGPREVAVLTCHQLSLYRTPGMTLLSHRPYVDTNPFLLTPTQVHFLSSKYGQVRHQGTDLGLTGTITSADDLKTHAVVYAQNEDGVNLCVFPYSKPRQKFNLELPGATLARARVNGHQLLVCDDRGRLLMADLRAQQWLAQHFL